jgi:DNA-3-methyladenine glycosylase
VNTSAARKARRPRRGAVLPARFFARDTATVARELLGAVLECRTRAGLASGRIVETEAYLGEHDAACHAAAGFTARTAPLYGPPGTAYVYFVYGMHWCVNAVTRARGLPSAVLIRALSPLTGLALMRDRRGCPQRDLDLTNGPAKLCEALGIDSRFNGLSLQRSPLVIRVGERVLDADVVVTPRVGIRRAADWPLRFLIAGDRFVSRAPPPLGRRHSPV